jgi:hypothetical protein
MYSASFKNWIFIFFCLLGAGAARAQSITLISGNGQLLDTSPHSQSQPMVVMVRDASGSPVKGATVSWTVSPTGQGNVLSAQTTTDATGQSTNLFTAEGGNLNSKSFVQSTVTASAEGGSVQFTLTTVEFNGAIDYDNVVLIKPTTRGATLVGQAGATQNEAVEVTVVAANGGTQQGAGIPNVSVAVVQANPTDTSTLSCSGGSVIYTDTAGTAICNLVFGGLVGSGDFTIVIGGTTEFGGFHYQVKAGAPAVFTNIQGNNQSGNPGQSLRLLSATLTDLGGNPVPNTPVTFTPVGAVTLSRVSTTTDAEGNVAALPTLGTGAGPVQVILAAGSVSTTFNLTINVIITGLNIVSGNQPQSALVNTQFASPLVVQVVDGTTPVAGVNVTFAVAGGSATLSSSTVITDANGQASVTVTAGPTAGPVTVTVTASGTQGQGSTQFSNLTVTPPGPVCNSAFDNGASFVPNKISPGGVAVIYCTSGVADGITGVVSADSYGPGPLVLPQEVQHVNVEFGEGASGVFAPIYYVANVNGQQSIAVQVPFELYPLSGTTIPVTISANSQAITLTVTIQQGAPGIFEYLLPDGVTKNAILLHADPRLRYRPDSAVHHIRRLRCLQ